MLVVCLCACGRGTARTSSEIAPYPPGAWRYDPTSLNETSIPLAQIMIGFRGARARSDLFMARAAERSRSEAMRLAVDIGRRASAGSEPFSELAAAYSDDDASRARAGRMGVVPANSLPPSWLDALAALEPGQVSRPIESSAGFHVLMPVALPEEGPMAAAEITIGYAGAQVPASGFRRAIERSRDDARALALRLHERLARDPTRFERLAREFSDDPSAERGGDIGIGSYGSGLWPFYWLGEVAEGEVSEVRESPYGFHLYRRLPANERARYAASLIVLVHDRVAGYEHAGAPFADALTRARALALELERAPERFDALRRQHCESAWCYEPLAAWSEGSGVVAFERVLRGLAVGEVTKEPLDTPQGLVLLRRDDPTDRSAPAPLRSYEMPQPQPDELSDAIAGLSADDVRQGARLLGEHAGRLLAFDDERQRAAFLEVLDGLARAFEDSTPEAKRAALRRTDQELLALLGRQRFADFYQLREEWFSSMQMR